MSRRMYLSLEPQTGLTLFLWCLLVAIDRFVDSCQFNNQRKPNVVNVYCVFNEGMLLYLSLHISGGINLLAAAHFSCMCKNKSSS